MILLKHQKTNRSSLLLSIFLLFVVFAATFSHLFQSSPKPLDDLNLLRNPFTSQELESFNSIEITNQIGRFRLEKDGADWTLVSPRRLPAKPYLVKSVLDALANINVKKLVSKDAINITNYSLSNPLIEITLEKGNLERKVFKVGLINPIDNSTYVMLESKPFIYQIGPLSFSLEKLDVSGLIDSHIFSQKIKDINEIVIWKGSKNRGRKVIDFSKENDIWKNHRGRQLEEDRVLGLLSDLKSMQSHLILDKRSKQLQDVVNKQLENPIYQIEVQSNDGHRYEYFLSHIINNVPDLKMKKRENIFVSASNRIHPYVLNKDYLKVFYIREQSYYKSSLNKMIY